jgi:hypothetical protein
LDVTLKRINHGYNIEVNEKATLHKPGKGETFESSRHLASAPDVL